MHLDDRRIAGHLAGGDDAATAHVHACADCAARATALEAVASSVFGDSNVPDHLRASAELDRVRQQLADAEAERERDPASALAQAELALSVLRDPSRIDTRSRLLRAAALREVANCHRYLGAYEAALAALDEAETETSGIAGGNFERARIGFVRATVLWKQGVNREEVLRLTEDARLVFEEYGESTRASHAQMLVGGVHFVAREYAQALSVFERLLRSPEVTDDATRAELHHNVAACQQELGDVIGAAEHLRVARVLYEHLGMVVESVRTEWLLGLMSIRSGRTDDGRERLLTTARSFFKLGNVSDGALVMIDLAEHLLAAGLRDDALAALDEIDRAAINPYVAVQLDLLKTLSVGPELERSLQRMRLHLSPPSPS